MFMVALSVVVFVGVRALCDCESFLLVNYI